MRDVVLSSGHVINVAFREIVKLSRTIGLDDSLIVFLIYEKKINDTLICIKINLDYKD